MNEKNRLNVLTFRLNHTMLDVAQTHRDIVLKCPDDKFTNNCYCGKSYTVGGFFLDFLYIFLGLQTAGLYSPPACRGVNFWIWMKTVVVK